MFRILGTDDNLKSSREDLIEELSEKCLALEIEATLFFDAQYNPEENQRHHRKNFEIQYTDYEQTADDLIIESLKGVAVPKNYIVVTSDKKLAWRARRRGATTQTVENFMDLLQRRWRNRSNVKTKKKLPEILPKEIQSQFTTYLKAFEEELASEPAPPPEKQKPLSETERWRQIFEQRLETELEDNSDLG